MLRGLLAFLLLSSPAFAGNVIFITIDGVRPEDAASVFADAQALTFPVSVANTSAKSLPGYRTLFTGQFENQCTDNYDCENIDRETLIDGLVDRGVPLTQIAAFASWKQLGLAIESRPRIFRSIAGIIGGAVDAVHPQLLKKLETYNASALADLPEWENAVKDEYTWSQAMDYLNDQKPKFLYVGLLDTDEWAHKSKKGRYFESLELLRQRIEQLQSSLERLGDYGRDTTIVLTTDHGRGHWPFFTSHGKWLRHSFKAWARIFPSQNAAVQDSLSNLELRTQLDLRPAIEQLLGSAPSQL